MDVKDIMKQAGEKSNKVIAKISDYPKLKEIYENAEIQVKQLTDRGTFLSKQLDKIVSDMQKAQINKWDALVTELKRLGKLPDDYQRSGGFPMTIDEEIGLIRYADMSKDISMLKGVMKVMGGGNPLKMPPFPPEE